MQSLEEIPLTINPPRLSDFEPISAILPEVLHSIVMAAQNAAQHPTPDTRSAERDDWRIAA